MYRLVLKKSSWLLSAQVVTKVISFFYTIFLARVLGVDSFGLYITALSYFALVNSFADFGMNQYLVREFVRSPDRFSAIFTGALMIRLMIVGFLVGSLSWILFLFDPQNLRASLSIMAIIAAVPQVVALTFDSLFVGGQKLYFSAIGFLTLSSTAAGLGVFLISQGYGVDAPIVSLLISQIIYALLLIILARRLKVSLDSPIDWVMIRQVFQESLPYGILGIMGFLYFKIDALMLSYIKGSFDTGIYGTAYKFLEAVIFVPSALSAALFPMLAKLDESNVRVKQYYFQSLKLFGVMGVLIMLGFWLVLPWGIRAFLPQYILSINAVQILSLTIPFMFIHVPASIVLLSRRNYLMQVLAMSLATLGFNIIANWFFIPYYGYLAASVITVISEILSFSLFYLFLQRRVFR